MKIIPVGIDDGNAYTKVAYWGDDDKTPEMFSSVSMIAPGRFPDYTKKRVYDFRGGEAVVITPDKANSSTERPTPASYHGGDMNKILVAEAMYAICDREGLDPEEVEFHSCLGLPIQRGVVPSIRARKKEQMTLLPSARGQKELIFRPPLVAPQGALAALLYDYEGAALIVDIGGGTTDIAEAFIEKDEMPTVDENRVGSLDFGVNRMIEMTGKAFIDATGSTSISSGLAMRAFQNGSLPYNGEEIDLAEAKQDAIDRVADDILQSLSRWQDSANYERILLIGGGAEIVSSRLRENLGALHVLENSQYANALAFLEMVSIMEDA